MKTIKPRKFHFVLNLWLLVARFSFCALEAHTSETASHHFAADIALQKDGRLGLGTAAAAHLFEKSFDRITDDGEVITVLEEQFGKKMLVVAHAGGVVSLLEVGEGIKELRKGERVEGARHLSVGAAAVTFTVATKNGCLLLCHTAGAVGAGVDGGIDLYTGVTKHDMEKTAVGGVKTTVAVLMVSSAAQPELAPALVPVAFLTYSGAVIVDVTYENRELIGDTAYGTWSDAKDIVKSTSDFWGQTSAMTCSTTKKYCASIKQGYGRQMDALAMSAYERSQELKDWLHL